MKESSIAHVSKIAAAFPERSATSHDSVILQLFEAGVIVCPQSDLKLRAQSYADALEFCSVIRQEAMPSDMAVTSASGTE